MRKKYIVILVMLCIYHSSFGITQSRITTTPLLSLSFGYYTPYDIELSSLGQFGFSTKLVFWDIIDLEYTYIMHSDYLLEPKLQTEPYHTHDLWLGYQFKIGDKYRLVPQIGSYWRSIPEYDVLFKGYKLGISNNIVLYDEILLITPFIGYCKNELSYGVEVSGHGGVAIAFTGIISYEHSDSFQLFSFNVQVGIPLTFLD